MTPSQYIKSQGIKSLAELSRASGIHRDTLTLWHRSRPDALRLLCYGYMQENSKDNLQDKYNAWLTAVVADGKLNKERDNG